jgi:hypothetical protein
MSDTVEKNLVEFKNEINKHINSLKLVDAARSAALPLAAIGAGAGFLAPVAFPVIAGLAGVMIVAAQAFSRHERNIIEREITDFKIRFPSASIDAATMTSSANNITVGRSSGSID